MLYSIVRPLAKTAFQVYFRKIYLSNQERIPKNKPVILACNHPTGFMEPCILATLLDRPLYFLVRGDFFQKPIFEKMLRALHMLPVFRWKDGGYRKLKHNFSTFAACHSALNEKRTIMIFAEGNTKYEKRLRPLKKGLARIAFGALDNYPEMEDVYVVPAGSTYTQAHQFRSEVMIDFGTPISTRAYYALYLENPAEGIAALTNELALRMQDCMVHIEKPDDDELVEQLLSLDRSDRLPPLSGPIILDDEQPLRSEQKLAVDINEMSPDEKVRLKENAGIYFNDLQRLGLQPWDVSETKSSSSRQRILLILGSIPAFTGYLLNFFPARLSKWLVDTRVKFIEFYGPVLVASAIGFYLVYYIFLLIAGGMQWGWSGLLLVAGIAFLGRFFVYYRDLYQNWQSNKRGEGLSPETRHDLIRQRTKLLAAANSST